MSEQGLMSAPLSRPTVRLLQNCVENRQLQAVMPGFEPFDFRVNPHPELREFQIFRHIVEEGIHKQADITGAVSSRFYAKSLRTSDDVTQWIQRTPGKDVYVVNPWPQCSYSVFNHQERANILHEAEFSAKCQQVLDKAGVGLNFVNAGRQHNGNHGMCSYWFASAAFWEGFVNDVVLPVLQLTPHELGAELHAFLYEPIQYYGTAAHRPGALPFMLERSSSLYIAGAFQGKAAFYPHTREEILRTCFFPFEQDLVIQFGDEIDAWDAQGQYPSDVRLFFDALTQHSVNGWLTYTLRHPLDFDNGDPRPRLPWYRQLQDRIDLTLDVA